MTVEAKVIADSTSADGVRLTTLQVTMHRFVLAEFNTHRVFSRNSASSRAIPVKKQIERIQADLAYPVVWPAEKPGMQGGEPLDSFAEQNAKYLWREASGRAVDVVRVLTGGKTALHKSVANRLLEPYMHHTVVVTSTAWANFFALRLDADAQPEIRVAAEAMKAAYDASTPVLLNEGTWHLPYWNSLEDGAAFHTMAIERWPGAARGMWSHPAMEADGFSSIAAIAIRVSAARCARTSYLTQEGKRDIDQDLVLYDRLVTDRVSKGLAVHWSPLEHVATPWPWNRQEGCIHFGQDPEADHDTFTCVPLGHLPRTGNLLGWRSLRTEVEAINGVRTFS